MDEKIRKIIDGLNRLEQEEKDRSGYWFGPDPERVEAICSVVPLDYPLTLSEFYDCRVTADDDDNALFLRFLTETGREWGPCDDSALHPVMLYERPAAEHNGLIYTADGWFFADGSGFSEGTWGDAIDLGGWWMQNQEDTIDTLVNAMWELCNGDVRVLLKRLEEYDGGLRHYDHEYIPDCTDEGSIFEDQWKWPTWKAFHEWCQRKGIADPFPEEWRHPKCWE